MSWPQLDGHVGKGSHGLSEQLRQSATQLSSKTKMQNTEQGNVARQGTEKRQLCAAVPAPSTDVLTQ